MPTIKENILFNYDGKWSDSFGLISVNLNNGMFEDTLVASREIIEVDIKGNDKPLFQGFKNQPLEFEMNIAFVDKYTDKNVEDIIDWLFSDYYKPLYFYGKENRIFYCTPTSDSSIVHNGMKEGYFTINMRCNSPFVYSPFVVSELYDLSDGISKHIELFNEGFGILYPEITIQKINKGNVSIQNLSNNGLIWEVRNIENEENVYIDCEKEIIKSDLEGLGVYHYNDTSGIFPKLLKGRNTLVINGRCKIQFRYRYKYRF